MKPDTTPTPAIGGSSPAYVCLPGWLDHLQQHQRLAVTHLSVECCDGAAAIAKRLYGQSASLFLEPNDHTMPVLGQFSHLQWIPEATGIESDEALVRFEQASLKPLPWYENSDAPWQKLVRRNNDLNKQLPIPTHNAHEQWPYIIAGLLIIEDRLL